MYTTHDARQIFESSKSYQIPSNVILSYLITLDTRLNSTSLLQQSRQLALLSAQIRVAADMLLLDEDVGHSALGSDLLERILDRGAVIYNS